MLQSIANNQLTPVDIVDIIFDKDVALGYQVSFQTYRRTDTSYVEGTGDIFATYNKDTATWRVDAENKFDSTGVYFAVTALGQLQYNTNDMPDPNYEGQITITGMTPE